jgi:phosphatidylserine/phosphatidylglycerophosphate/cardiolipin synthase-like enzyme
VLLDGGDYFGALRSSLLKARRSILIAGWDIDSRMRLVGPGGSANDGWPEALRAFLERLIEDRPDLEIRLLLWDYSILYALEREPLTALKLNWRTPSRLYVEMDDCLPLGGAHHQKIAVIDDSVAYCGGLDLTTRRWDTRQHKPGDRRRQDPSGSGYAPFHDVQMVVDGEAAAALGELLRERWRRSSDDRSVPGRVAPADPAPWPDHVQPDFRSQSVGIARTVAPVHDGDSPVEEVRALYLASIAAACRYVYI